MMKNYSYVLAGAFSLLLFSGCSQEESVEGAETGNENMETLVFTASSQASTRNSLETNGSILWKVGDKIWVNGKVSELLKASDIRGGGVRADFTVKTDPLPTAPFNGLFTTDEGVSYDVSSKTYSLTFSDEQKNYNVSQKAFSNFGVNPMVAMSSLEAPNPGYTLEFKNVCGIVRLSVKCQSYNIKGVRFIAADGDKVSGTAKIKVPDNVGSVPTLVLDNVQSGFSGKVNQKTVLFTSNYKMNDFVQVDIVLPAGTYKSGWKIGLIGIDNSMIHAALPSETELTVERAKIKKIGIYDFNMETAEFKPDEVGIQGGAIWAPSDLFTRGTSSGFSGDVYFFQASPDWAGDAIAFDPKMMPSESNADINQTEDPCNKVKPVGTWKMATKSDWQKLLSTSHVKDKTLVSYYTGNKNTGYYHGNASGLPASPIDPTKLDASTAAKLVFFPQGGLSGERATYWVGSRDGARNQVYYITLNNGNMTATTGGFNHVNGTFMSEKRRVRCVKR